MPGGERTMRRSAFIAWLGLMPLMILNGVIRQSIYGPYVGELAGHQISTATGIALLLAYLWLVFPRLRLRSAREAWRLGLLWLGLTLAFEFLFGRFVVGHSWVRLLQDYDLLAGRVWVLFLVAVVLGPLLIYRLRAGEGPGPA